ncbi:potassium transporter KefA [Candidatus Saccharibacteria bacterium]|nr:potassium transporter KefA [Candidatus Saccharibacteria bacterium]MBJ58567.1 potassium transporter KefA [Candidatus Saccharibacteria bacterium]MBJ58821.1 potassium transporter KefA [Candidatus Saccharibacteria bacterium]MBQ68793.1 potassium transporter KefA [Candidatus Saccharibacteria bacterium]|tara:strand:- start:1356 stop:2210 length:855 start_codon:yes stop_codon:yes gene_type:complete
MNIPALLDNPLMQILLIIAIAYGLHRFFKWLIGAIIERAVRKEKTETVTDVKKRRDTVAGIIRALVSLLVWLIAAGAILVVLNVDLARVAAGAGFLGIIIGLGAQATIRDYLAGFFILLESQYRVGDVVTLNGAGVSQETSGVVEDITLRITKLRDLDGTLHIVRNGEASIITNRTFKFSSIVLDIGVDYDSDLDHVEKVMNRVGKHMLQDPAMAAQIKEPIQFLRVEAFADSSVVMRALGKVQPAQQWEIAGQYRRLIHKEFKKEGIVIAFPQLVVHDAGKKN